MNTLFVPLQRWRRGAPHARPLDRHAFALAGVLAVFTLLGNLCSATAVQTVSPAVLNVLLRSEVLGVAVLAWVALGERVEPRFWVGAAIAGVGLVVLQQPGATGEVDLRGLGFGLAAALCFSALAVVIRRSIHRIDPSAVNALRLWLSLPLWFALNGVPPELFELSRAQVGYAAMAALTGPFLGRLMMMFSAQYIDARLTTLGLLCAPAMTLVLELIFLGDLPRGEQILGGAIMIGGIALTLVRFAGRGAGDTVPLASQD